MNVAIDSYYCFTIQMVSGNLNTLGQRFTAIPTDGRNFVYYARLELIRHIHTHRRINKNFELIGKNLEWAYFCQVLLSGIVISSITMEVARVLISYLIISNYQKF